jgi:hypothetical protein
VRARFADDAGCATVAAMLERGVHAPETAASAAGSTPRADCSACSAGWRSKARRRCGSKARRAHGASPTDRSLFAIAPTNELDLAPLLARLADEPTLGFGAALFHATLPRRIAEWDGVAASAKARPPSRAAAAASSTRCSRALRSRSAVARHRDAARRAGAAERRRHRARPGVGRAAASRPEWSDCASRFPPRSSSCSTATAPSSSSRRAQAHLARARRGVVLGDHVIVHVGYALRGSIPTRRSARSSLRRGRMLAGAGRDRMKYVDEFRDGRVARRLAARDRARRRSGARLHLMEFCGGHTHAISRYGVKDLAARQRAHGPRPGLPGLRAADRPHRQRDRARVAAGVILCTYADTMRVPASKGLSLLKAKARGADIAWCIRAPDAVRIARENPGREVVFFAIGFETTTPPTAVAIGREREGSRTSASSATTC